MPLDDESDRIGRREFSRLAIGTGLATGLTIMPTTFASTHAAEDTPVPKKADAPKADVPELPPPPPEVLLLTYLLRKYPNEHFDEQAVQGVFRDIRGDVARGKALAEFDLKNSDEPAFVFRAFRSGDGIPADN